MGESLYLYLELESPPPPTTPSSPEKEFAVEDNKPKYEIDHSVKAGIEINL